MDKNYVCPCGLTCCDCLFYKSEIYETAKKFKKVITDSQLDIFLGLISKNEGWKTIANHLNQDEHQIGQFFESFKKIPDFLKVLDSIIDLQCKKTCQESGGCSIGGITCECEAIKCITAKGYDGCWDCAEVESCDKLNFLKRNYGETVTGNLKIMKQYGFESVKSRENKYYTWQQHRKA